MPLGTNRIKQGGESAQHGGDRLPTHLTTKRDRQPAHGGENQGESKHGPVQPQVMHQQFEQRERTAFRHSPRIRDQLERALMKLLQEMCQPKSRIDGHQPTGHSHEAQPAEQCGPDHTAPPRRKTEPSVNLQDGDQEDQRPVRADRDDRPKAEPSACPVVRLRVKVKVSQRQTQHGEQHMRTHNLDL